MVKEQSKQGPKESKRPKELEQKTSQEQRKFSRIRDLLYIDFSFDGIEIISVYSAMPSQMDKLANMYFNISDVNVEIWPVEERLDFVNHLWDFCQKKGYKFPLRIRKSTKELNRPVETSDRQEKFTSM